MRDRPSAVAPLLQTDGGSPHPASTTCDAKSIVVRVLLTLAESGLCLLLVWGIKNSYYDLAQCDDAVDTKCTFEAGKAAGDKTLPILSAAVATDQLSCCNTCAHYEGCAVATYIIANDTTTATSDWNVNCLMYSSASYTPHSEVTRPDAALCVPPATTRVISEIAAWMDEDGEGQDEFMIGGAAIIVRFGYIFVAYALTMLQTLCGYRGASLAQTVMAPREAARAVAASAALQVEPTPDAARWDAIAGEVWPDTFFNRNAYAGESGGLRGALSMDMTPATWTDVTGALGLTRRQSIWSAASVLLVWHLVQPLGYLLVLPFYYCDLNLDTSISDILPLTQSDLAVAIAVREIIYIVLCIVSTWWCPAYLLMEMDTVRLEPKRWCIWLCQPQTFVTLCLARRFSSRRFKVVGAAFFVLLWLQTVADLLSVAALWGLLAPPAPAGLAHGAGGLILGYMLTTASVAGSALGLAIASLSAVRSGELENSAMVLCCVLGGLASGVIVLLGVYLIILAPFQLAGIALHGVPLM